MSIGIGIGIGLGSGKPLTADALVSRLLATATNVTSLMIGDDATFSAGVLADWQPRTGPAATWNTLEHVSATSGGRPGIRLAADGNARALLASQIAVQTVWGVLGFTVLPPDNAPLPISIAAQGDTVSHLFVYPTSTSAWMQTPGTGGENVVHYRDGAETPNLSLGVHVYCGTRTTGAVTQNQMFGGDGNAGRSHKGFAGFYMAQNAAPDANERTAIFNLLRRYYRIA